MWSNAQAHTLAPRSSELEFDAFYVKRTEHLELAKKSPQYLGPLVGFQRFLRVRAKLFPCVLGAVCDYVYRYVCVCACVCVCGGGGSWTLLVTVVSRRRSGCSGFHFGKK